jgi:uncharacterized membrane protein
VGFIWDDGVFSDLPLPPQSSSGYATTINNRGQVAGYIVGQDWFVNPVVWVQSHAKAEERHWRLREYGSHRDFQRFDRH